jgi:hypothetical protein
MVVVVVLVVMENHQEHLLVVIQSIRRCFSFTSFSSGYPITIGGGGAGGCWSRPTSWFKVQIQFFQQLHLQVVDTVEQIVILQIEDQVVLVVVDMERSIRWNSRRNRKYTSCKSSSR